MISGHEYQKLRADCHVHIYAPFDLATLLRAVKSNLSTEDQATAVGCFLTETRGLDFFKRLLHHPEVSETWDGVAKVAGVYFFAGRQVATAERLEVLALCTQQLFVDGLPFREAIHQVRQAGLVPVTPWSPGKWTLRRGGLVAEVVRNARPGELLLADSSLRPAGMSEPRIFQEARQRGLGIIAGSDPLPFQGQETLIGSFGCEISQFDPQRPRESVLAALAKPNPEFPIFGSRSSFFQVGTRLFRNKFSNSGKVHQSQRASE